MDLYADDASEFAAAELLDGCRFTRENRFPRIAAGERRVCLTSSDPVWRALFDLMNRSGNQ